MCGAKQLLAIERASSRPLQVVGVTKIRGAVAARDREERPTNTLGDCDLAIIQGTVLERAT
jgi:hypothetical protein